MFELKTELMPHQRVHVDKAIKRRRLLLVEHAGRGKTLIELASVCYLLNNHHIEKTFISVPLVSYTKKSWQSECSIHTNLSFIDLDTLLHLSAGSVSRAISILKDYQLCIFKHTAVKRHLSFIKDLVSHYKSMVIIDEVQAFKNPKSTLTRLSRQAFASAFAFHTITATPLSRDLTDTYNIINFTRPGILGTFTFFRETYCNYHEETIHLKTGKRKIIKLDGFKQGTDLDQILDYFVLRGEATIKPSFHFYAYDLSKSEHDIYTLIARGIFTSSEDEYNKPGWLETLFTSTISTPQPKIKNIEAYSSRFIYLQYAADGIISPKGKVGNNHSSKLDEVYKILDHIYSKGESALIYCSYHVTINILYGYLQTRYQQATILKSTGKDHLDSSDVTEEKVKIHPYFILCTKAGSESTSYYFLNHVIFVHYPTVAETIIQMVGRICRINTLFPGDLHVYMPFCHNIDNYKLFLVSHKTSLMEVITGKESSLPDTYKNIDWSSPSVRQYKNQLIWNIQPKRTPSHYDLPS